MLFLYLRASVLPLRPSIGVAEEAEEKNTRLNLKRLYRESAREELVTNLLEQQRMC